MTQIFTTYELPDGRLGQALEAAFRYAADWPPAYEHLFEIRDGRLAVDLTVDWERAAACHHSNIPLVGTLGAMVDPAAAARALPGIPLAAIVGGCCRLDEHQEAILAAMIGPGGPGKPDAPRSCFGTAVRTLIVEEGLEDYFDLLPDPESFDIRLAGYAQSCREKREAYARGLDPEPRDLFAAAKARAQKDRLDPGRRIALVAVMALYNEHETCVTFKGRGWSFGARELGTWLRNRAEVHPAAFEALLLAMATYHGW